MAEPTRHASDASAVTARDSQVEALLLEGLDRYFDGRYDEAIHIWTRVLFFDRSHARARAYIERARTALAERQRRADEMLQASQELLTQGRTAAARDLLHEAVETSGDDERASALRQRLERLERASSPVSTDLPEPASSKAIPGWSWPRRSPGIVGLAVTLLAGLLVVVAVGTPTVQEWLGLPAANEQLLVAATPTNLPVLSSAEASMIRAQTLYRRGRLAEALAALQRVRPESPQRVGADQLRIEIQRLLLASGREPSRGAGAEGGGSR